MKGKEEGKIVGMYLQSVRRSNGVYRTDIHESQSGDMATDRLIK